MAGMLGTGSFRAAHSSENSSILYVGRDRVADGEADVFTVNGTDKTAVTPTDQTNVHNLSSSFTFIIPFQCKGRVLRLNSLYPTYHEGESWRDLNLKVSSCNCVP